MNPEHPAAAPDAVDPAAVKRAFGRAAGTYEAAAVLQREVGARMAERLDLVKLSPEAILDAGCGTGEALGALAARYPAARRTALDLAWPMVAAARERHCPRRSALARVVAAWRRSTTAPPLFVTGDIAALPFAAGTFGLVWSNLALQWIGDLPRALSEMHRVLRVEGLAMFTTLGPDTLRELRAAFRDADSGPHVNRFADMHDVGDMLVQAGFADPVMHMERITLTYADPLAVVRDLKAIGATNATVARRRGLLGRGRWSRMLTALDGMRRDGRIPATFEVVYGHAWKVAPTRTPEGHAIVRVERLQR